MDQLIEYWTLTISGFENFVSDYKYLALVISVLIYSAFHWKRYANKKRKRFLLYSGAITVLLMIPVTAIIFQIYQTRFYDYAWIWCCIPLTAVLAWGIVTVVFDEISSGMTIAGTAAGGRRLYLARCCGMAVALVVLFMCGNLGNMQKVSEEQLAQRYASEEILQYLEDEELLPDHVIWAPKDTMQYLRSHSGEVILFYGRDMWDAKAGAYDYETYEEQETACYEWMELVTSPHSLYLLKVEQAPDYIHEALASDTYLREAINREVDIIILPSQITNWIERKIKLIAAEENASVRSEQIDKFTVWILE